MTHSDSDRATIEVLKRSLSRASDIIQEQEASAHRDHATITALKLALLQAASMLEADGAVFGIEAATARFRAMAAEDWEALP